MIYSRWRPDTGGYDYFETAERYGLADDLPTPPIGGPSPIGVSSLACGRKIPLGARAAGSGRSAKGVIAPVSRSGLSGTSALASIAGMPYSGFWALGGVVLGTLAYVFWKRRA